MPISDIRISTYGMPRWDARVTGSVTIRKDTQARYYVDNVGVAAIRVEGLFTIITCVDNATHYVLTAFFRLLDRAVDTE